MVPRIAALCRRHPTIAAAVAAAVVTLALMACPPTARMLDAFAAFWYSQI